MITGTITHPGVLRALAGAGHGSTVLISDGHWAATRTGRNASTVFLNLTAGTPTVTDVASAILDTVRIEHATQMEPSPDALPSEVQDEIARLLGPSVPRSLVTRAEFHALATSDDLALLIVTGDRRRFGNVLLRVGVLPHDASQNR